MKLTFIISYRENLYFMLKQYIFMAHLLTMEHSAGLVFVAETSIRPGPLRVRQLIRADDVSWTLDFKGGGVR